MRIPAHEVLFIGNHLCPEFECPQTLPKELDILLCLLDGAERRLKLRVKINAGGPDVRPEKRDPVHCHSAAGLD